MSNKEMSNSNKFFTKENVKKYLKEFFFSFAWLAIILVIVDQMIKLAIVNHYDIWNVYNSGGMSAIHSLDSYVVIPGFFSITPVLNNGAAFGMFGTIDNDVLRRTILIGVSIIMSIVFVGYYIWKYKKINRITKLFLMCMFAGAFGNFIDRAFYPEGMVVDMFKFDFWPGFGVFNFADSVLVVTVIGAMIYLIVDLIRSSLNKTKNDSPKFEAKPVNTENVIDNNEVLKEQPKITEVDGEVIDQSNGENKKDE